MKRLAPYLVFVVLAHIANVGQADLIYVDPVDIPIFGVSSPAIVEFDFNDDAVIDFVLQSSPPVSEFFVEPQGGNRAAVNEFLFLKPIQAGVVIASTPDPSYDWSAASPIGITATASFPTGTVIIGEFNGQTAFMGAEFDIDGNTHYGWIRMSVIGGGGTILDYAYESTPGQGLVAGVIPEPSSAPLLLIGLTLLFSRARRVVGARPQPG